MEDKLTRIPISIVWNPSKKEWLARMQWQKIQDPLAAELWIAELESAIVAIQNIENESLSSHLNNLSQASDSIPSPSFVTAESEDLRAWGT